MPPSTYPPHPGAGHYPYPHHNFPGPSSSAPRNKHVHFPDSFSPSSFTIRIQLGPRENPSSIVKISVEFEPGRFPRVKVRSRKVGEEEEGTEPGVEGEGRRRRRRRRGRREGSGRGRY